MIGGLLLVSLLAARADDTDPPEPPAVPAAEPGPAEEAERVRLRERMDKLAARGAWTGVERTYRELHELGTDADPDVEWLGSEAALMLGDTWTAYQRLVVAVRLRPGDPLATARMRELRETYGRLTVQRADDTPIDLEADVVPFAPDQRASVQYATRVLWETGGFDGMIPAGSYRLGGQPVVIRPGFQEPVVVRREARP